MYTEEFIKEHERIVKRAFFLHEKARREGLLALEDEIDEEKIIKRDLLELGILLVMDGVEREFIDKVLSNIANLEEDLEKKLLNTVKKEAVLEIQAGVNSYLLLLLLNSFVYINVEDVMKKFLEDY